MSQPPHGARDATLSVIPAGASFQGILTWRGAVRVEGSLEGDAVARGALEIGPEARVHGNVMVDDLVVAGILEGDALATRRIELRPGARVVGDLRAPVVVVADGCSLEGRLEMGAVDPAAGASESPGESASAGPQEAFSAPLSP